MDIVGLQCLCEPCAVAAGAFHAGTDDLAQATGPADRRPVARWVGAELGIAEQLTGIGDRGQVDGVEMSVGADDDAAVRCHDGGVLKFVGAVTSCCYVVL
ncbi:hypothetical protein MBOU_55400 [Mycobacterium bourgelatii]|uniref:Uncharacterized protein n=1 Tax=Mycobacterium bourgelatii TaxID=1273442 RepID=A0A7I9YY05_MYCBU|nr:hypothetical protein MBOU_55400 [Mycobacterium bourgelatii]